MQPCVPAGRLEVGAMLCSHSRDMSHGWDACCGRETSATSRNECPYFLAAPTVAGVPAPGHVGAAWARGNHLQSSNHMKLWKPFHWMPTSLACVVSTLTDPAHLSLLLSVVVIVTRFRCPWFLLFMAEGLKPTSYQGPETHRQLHMLRSPWDCVGNTSLAPKFPGA